MKLVPAPVAVEIAPTSPLSPNNVSRITGTFSKTSARAAWSNKVPSTTRQLKDRRSSEIAQAKPMITAMPSADCKCGSSVRPREEIPKQRYTISASAKAILLKRGIAKGGALT